MVVTTTVTTTQTIITITQGTDMVIRLMEGDGTQIVLLLLEQIRPIMFQDATFAI